MAEGGALPRRSRNGRPRSRKNIKALGRVLRSVSVCSVVELFQLLDLAERIVKRAAHRPHLVE